MISEGGEELYRHLFEPLAEQGFIVLANDVAVGWNVSKRMRSMFCTLLWAQSEDAKAWSESANQRLNCDVVAMGHSRGGEAAYHVVASFPGFMESLAMDLELRAAVAIAPRMRLSTSTSDPDILSFSVSASRVVPYLALMGGNDEDVTGNALAAYDLMGPEEDETLPIADKVLLWAYDVIHGAWGGRIPDDQLPEFCGRPPDLSPTMEAKGHALAATYVSRFLSWQVHGDASARSALARITRVGVSTSDFPPEVADPLYWGNIEPEYTDLDSRPLIYADYTVPDGGEAARLQVDTMAREGDDPGCKPLAPSTLGLGVGVSGLDPGAVCIDRADLLKRQEGSVAHETAAMRVTWGPSVSGSIDWEIDENVSTYTHLSLRIGRTAMGASDPEPPIDGVRIRLRSLVDGQVGGGVVPLETLIRQDRSPALDNVFPRQSEMMHTVRVPLERFCAQSLDPEHVTELSLVLMANGADPREILVDSLEFTRHPSDANGGC